jgi:hypothetical protein
MLCSNGEQILVSLNNTSNIKQKLIRSPGVQHNSLEQLNLNDEELLPLQDTCELNPESGAAQSWAGKQLLYVLELRD